MVLHHNQLRDIFVDFCNKANLSVKVEAGTLDLSRSRPADALVSNSEAKYYISVQMYGKLNIALVRCNARALLSTACNLV